jgi:hypothetical protein
MSLKKPKVNRIVTSLHTRRIKLQMKHFNKNLLNEPLTYGDEFGLLPKMHLSEISVLLLLKHVGSWTWDRFEITVLVRPRSFPSTSFPIHYYLIIILSTFML